MLKRVFLYAESKKHQIRVVCPHFAQEAFHYDVTKELLLSGVLQPQYILW